MTISAQKAVASATWLLHSQSPTRTPSAFTARGWSIADSPSVAHWMSGDDPEACRDEVVDRIYRLTCLPGFAARNADDVWIGAASSALPARIANPAALAGDQHFNPREAPYDPGETREEGRAAPSHSALLNSYRLLQAFRAGANSFTPKTLDFKALAGDRHPDLCDALRDLEEARGEAHEEGFAVPSDVALGNARRLLHAMYRLSPRRFEIYPMPDGEIAIDVPGGPGRSVLLLCNSDGGALCSVNMNGAHRRARYSDARGLPDGFVCDALAELERLNNAAA